MEFIRLAHQTQRLAEAFGMGHPEIPGDVVFGILPLLVAHHGYWHAVKLGQTSDNRQIVSEQAVAMQLHEVGEDGLNILNGRWTLGGFHNLDLFVDL
ncbi:hypothetical protein D3C81_1818900 [compost metagenome]